MCNEDGNVETVTGCLINTLRSPSTDSVAATYEFALYSTGYSLTKNQTDGSVSVRAYSTINYNTQNTPTEYLLTSVSGHWTILDSTVSVTNADLHYLGLMAVHSLYLLLLRMHYINMDNSIYSFEIYSIKDSLWKLASCLTLAVLFFLKNKKKLKKESAIQIIIIGMIVITLFLDGIGIGPFYATMTCFDVSALLRYLSLLFCLSMTDKAQNACEHGLF